LENRPAAFLRWFALNGVGASVVPINSDLRPDALPLTATNKVQRGELKSWARTLPGTRGCIDTRHLKQRRTTPA
jgi:hypothetical protein